MPFEPIAIIGCSCVFPGALTPDALFDIVNQGRDLLSPVPENYWRTDPRLVMAASPKEAFDLTWTDRGGYVTGFEKVFDPTGFTLSPSEIAICDPLIHWLLYCGKEALKDAGSFGKEGGRRGAVFGNLSYPSHTMQEFAESVWLDSQGKGFVNGKAREIAGLGNPHAINRFMSGYPAHLLARSLGLTAGAFALDAACASSLYAVKIACDTLQERKADLMLAGGINRSDDLIIHIGFCSLQAMSQTGQSRPFHKEADGLVPAEGAGFVVLKRLADAVASGDPIQGVIRGVGLSNDGRGHGLLVPSEEGQFQAMKKAYALSGLSPSDISLVECHATGTPVGDEIEIRSMSRIFKGLSDIPIGTIKSNMGHPITASGVAGIIKVLQSFKHGVRPKTLHVETPMESIKGSPFRLLHESEPWKTEGVKRAAISNFGFGGNNAHIILESWEKRPYKPLPALAPQGPPPKIAVVGMGMVVSHTKEAAGFKEALFSGKETLREMNEGILGGFADPFELPLMGLKFFPAALDQTLSQQLLMLKAALEAVEDAGALPTARTGVLVGMGCDTEVTRSGLCWRLRHWLNRWSGGKEAPHFSRWVSETKDQINHAREPSAILGAMPNIVANRLCSQFDFQGPSHTISAEEISGLRALERAISGLRNGDIDAALVGAVDMSCEPIHLKAVQDILAENRRIPGDAAVALVLKRLDDAEKNNDTVYALLSDEPAPESAVQFGFGGGEINLTRRFGHSHAASGLVHVAAAVVSCYDGKIPSGESAPAAPWETGEGQGRVAQVAMTALGGESSVIRVESASRRVEKKAGEKKGKPPSRTYQVHLKRVKFTPFDSSSEAALPKRLHMPPSPTLPGTIALYQASSPLMKPPYQPAPGKAAANHRPVPPPSSLSPFARPAALKSASHKESSLMKKLLQHLVEKNHQIALIHKEFVQQQETIHKQFLDVQAQAMNTLTRLATSGWPLPEQRVSALNPELEGPGEPADFSTEPAHSLLEPAPFFEAPKPMAQTPRPKPAATGTTERSTLNPPKAKEAPVVEKKETGAVNPLLKQFENPLYIEPEGPTFSKDQLEILASGKISEVFGPMFKIQDDFQRQVRLPEYPLLLADRITGLKAEPGSLGKGIIWTETDVLRDAWYSNDGYMPAGVTVESGQCDLTLVSYLGADFKNKGERVYRLLGCDLMYYGEPPRAGDTLCYQIHVDGYANIGNTRIFFFRYDCRIRGELRLSVRNAQAGFFSDQELANSKGILWTPETGEHKPDTESVLTPPAVPCTRSAFTEEQVKAFSEGRVYECFGPGFEIAETHSKTPKIQSGMMCLIDKVTHFDPKGGPWKRGYLRVENQIPPDAWYLTCHFKNDPCMPGTLMSDACLQTMSFYIAAMGHTLKKDGWRFDPIPNEVISIKCRGQVTPSSKTLVYETFVEEFEIVDGLYPTLWADILATCDGLKILHIRRMGLRLVPDWPLDCWPHLLENYVEKRQVAKIDGMEFGYKSLLACAFGKPSDAFGPPGAIFNTGRHIARLPGPPYHFMTRVSMINATPGAMKTNEVIDVEYDVPPGEWYFNKNGNKTMPLCVLMEVALQPCGWLAVFEGGPATSDKPLYFRNLDGVGKIIKEIKPDTGVITTRTQLVNIARVMGVILVRFQATCFVEGEKVYEMETGFGFFSSADLSQQIGLGAKKEEIAWLDEPNDFLVDLTQKPERYCKKALRMPDEMLLMIDKVTGYWPKGGPKALGMMRAEKKVNVSEWFFKAHFFHDPVQPGSLGVEAILQLIQFYMIHVGLDKGIENPRFTPVGLDQNFTWKYRGQVTPEKKRISVEIHIHETGQDEKGAYVIAEGFLWADSLRIFNVKNIRMEIVSGGHFDGPTPENESPPDPSGKKKIENSRELIKREADSVIKKVAAHIGVPEKYVRLSGRPGLAVCDARPMKLYPYTVSEGETGEEKIRIGDPFLDFETMLDYSRKVWNVGPWIGERLSYGLLRQFTGEIVLEDPVAFDAVKDRSLLYLANHQVQSESILFSMIVKVLAKRRMVVISDSIHQTRWTGPVDELMYRYPGVNYPKTIVYFTQSNRKSMFDILEDFKQKIREEGVSVFLHPEGKLGLSCRHPVKTLSSVFLDLAIDMDLPIIPVKFAGGLPVEEMKDVRDFPMGYGRQDYHIGKPILPEELKKQAYADRRKLVIDAINGLGPSCKTERPNPPDPVFMKEVSSWIAEKGVSEVQAVIFKAFERLQDHDPESRRFIQRAYDKSVTFGDDPKGKWLSELAAWLFD